MVRSLETQPVEITQAAVSHSGARGEPNPKWTAIGLADPSPVPQKAPGGLSPELAVTALEDYLGCPLRPLLLRRGIGVVSAARGHAVPSISQRHPRGSGLAPRTVGPAQPPTSLSTWTPAGRSAAPPTTPRRYITEAPPGEMLVNAGASMSGHALTAERRLTIEGVTITARADHIQMAEGAIVIQRMKAGRLAKRGETPKARYALLQAMVKRDEGWPPSAAYLASRWQPERRNGCCK